MNNTYELTYIISGQLSEEEVVKCAEALKKLLPNGQVIEEKAWGRRELAYPINKQKAGYYFTLVFQAEPSQIGSLNQKLKLQEEVLRYLIVKTTLPPEKTAAKPIEKKSQKSVRKTESKPEAKIEKKEKKEPKAQKETKLSAELEEEAEKMRVLEEKLKEILKE